MEPAHTHDCDECIFVGADGPVEGEPRTNQVDMYVHLSTRPFGGSLIRRYSSEGADYGSFDPETGRRFEKYRRVIAAAEALGIKIP